jgi:chaperonin GroES
MATATKTIKPLEDRILVRPEEGEETTASGIVIPDTAKEKPQEGTVLAIGPGKRSEQGELIPMDVSEGDRVIYSKYGGTDIKLDGEDLLILSSRDVLAIVGGSHSGSAWGRCGP